MQKTYIILTVAFFSMLFTRCNSGDKELNRKLSEMAASLNESAPVMLDAYTRFEEASVSSDNVFRYRYTVLNTTNPDSLVESGAVALVENIKKEFSGNPDLLIFKENKVVIEYMYNDENNRNINLIRITPDDYQ